MVPFLTQKCQIFFQNNRNWSQARPIDGIEISLHDEKVLVWCAILAKGIYGPHFFENSVNQHNYLKLFSGEDLHTYFQQDGATPHTANTVQNWLGDKFSKKLSIKDLKANISREMQNITIEVLN